MRRRQLPAVEQILENTASVLELAETLQQQGMAKARFRAGVAGGERRVFMQGLAPGYRR